MNTEIFVPIEKINSKIRVLKELKSKIETGEYINSEIDDLLIENEMLELKTNLYSESNSLWNTKIEEEIENCKIQIEKLMNNNEEEENDD